MKRLACCIGMLSVLTLGCVRIEQTWALNPDGSGTIELDYSILDRTVGQLEAMLDLARDLGELSGDPLPDKSDDLTMILLNPTEDILKRKMAEYESLGVRIEKLEVTLRDGRRQVSMMLKFDSVETLAEADLFAEHGFSLTKTETGDYLLRRSPSPPGIEEPPRVDDDNAVRNLAPLLAGFHAVYEVKTPTRILRSNARGATMRTVKWEFDFNQDPNAFADYNHKDLGVVFSGKDLDLPLIKQRPEPPAEKSGPTS